MYIKRLEIVGFKSFPDRALVPLSQGISAVVGPNGCGKSNIIDAIRWVMGEQSPKMLRGRNMDDVLFNGSQGRPASALAEVTLTLARDYDPESGVLAPAETSVTRRLYRSGDSEYLISKVPCRLKDVIHFFMDAGVGTRAYGIIEQGRVGWLVDARPEERRTLIDEAAGITRYKQQKKEAERKIEAAEQNLDNVSIIKAETKKQLDQIARQAEKAARFKALKAELRELDLALSAKNLMSAWAKGGELVSRREENRRLLVSLLAEADKHELEMESFKLFLVQAEKDLEEKMSAWHHLNSLHEGLKKEAEFAAERLKQSAGRKEQVEGEADRIRSEKSRKLEEEARLEEEAAELENDFTAAQSRTESLREKWRGRKSAFDELKRQEAQASGRLADIERELAALAETMAGSERMLIHHQEREAELGAEETAVEAAALEAQEKLALLKQNRGDIVLDLEGAREEADFRREEVAVARRELEEGDRAAAAASARLAGLSGKLETLESVKGEFGWYPQGVKALMAAGELKNAGLIGPLAEFLEIPAGYEEAVEAALGERLAWLLVEDRAAGLTALKYLNEHQLGRCGFISKVDLAAGGLDLAQALLGDFALAENLLEAAAMPLQSRLLTKTGEYLGGGLLAGGRAAADDGQAAAGLLARLKEVELLTAEVFASENNFAKTRNNAFELRERLAAAQEAAQASENRKSALEARLVEMDKALVAAESETRVAENRQASVAVELTKARQTAADLSSSLVSGRAKRAERQAEVQNWSAAAQELASRVQEDGETLEDLRTDGEEARLAESAAGERRERARNDLSHVSEWLADVEGNLNAREAEGVSLGADMESQRRRGEELSVGMADFPARLEAAEREVGELRAGLEEHRRKTAAKENEAREVRHRREGLHGILNNQETELLALQFTEDKLAEDLLRDWRVVMPNPFQPEEALAEEESGGDGQTEEAGDDLNKGEGGGMPEEPLSGNKETAKTPAPETLEPQAGEEAPRDESGTAEAASEAPPMEVLNPQEWALKELPGGAAAKRDALKNKISSLGEVSLGAIEKETELAAEYERYQSQHDDLTKAIADLRDSINKINYTCKRRFTDTFKSVDEKFREIFPILFEGGEGWLSLTDDGDPLESGVEIHVHPPGKKVLVMSLLSGGEKALTALALIFALYLIKPSPFCLLDETDAPLDEANIDRFNRLLRQLSRSSQIIMVTHNKRTMQISHTLYGVTMETPGVSKLVSVNLAEAEALTGDAQMVS